MAARCKDEGCAWSGTSSDVANAGGSCPKCGGRVSYDFAPIQTTTISNVDEFNRRALVALRACSLNAWDEGFVASIRPRVERYDSLLENEQENLVRAVLRHAGSIGDQSAVDYASRHYRGR